MSNRDDGGALVGLSRRDAAPGMSATSEHVLEERGFDLVAALFGGPDSHGAKLPDAALALLVHGIVLDFVGAPPARPWQRCAGAGNPLRNGPRCRRQGRGLRHTDFPPRGRHGGHRADGGLRARAVGRRYGAGAPARGARDAAAGSPGRPHPAPPSSPQAADGQRGALAGTDCGCRLALRPRQPSRAAASDARWRTEADPGRPARGDREGWLPTPASPWTAPNFWAPRHRSRPRWQRSGCAATAAPRR